MARARLAETAPPGLDPGAEPLIIRDSDSPREIRQKAQLLEDVADQLEARSQALQKEVAHLETERRLRTRASAFARDLDLFGETLPEGRSVTPSPTSSVRPPTESLIPGPADAALTAEREVALAGGPVAFDDGLESEIARLRADRARLEERLSGLKASADSFRVRAARLLEAAH